MDASTRDVLAAFLILGGFGLAAYFMPSIMLAVGEFSQLAAAVLAILFVLGFFGVFWLRARWQKRENR